MGSRGSYSSSSLLSTSPPRHSPGIIRKRTSKQGPTLLPPHEVKHQGQRLRHPCRDAHPELQLQANHEQLAWTALQKPTRYATLSAFVSFFLAWDVSSSTMISRIGTFQGFLPGLANSQEASCCELCTQTCTDPALPHKCCSSFFQHQSSLIIFFLSLGLQVLSKWHHS